MDTCTGSRNQWNIKAWILKMYSRSAKGGEKGDPNRNPWLAKMGDLRIRHKTAVPFSPLHIWIRILVVYVVKISRRRWPEHPSGKTPDECVFIAYLCIHVINKVIYMMCSCCVWPHGNGLVGFYSLQIQIQIQIQIFYWHKHNYNNWQRPKVKLQFMFMNRKHNNMTLLWILNNLISKS